MRGGKNWEEEKSVRGGKNWEEEKENFVELLELLRERREKLRGRKIRERRKKLRGGKRKFCGIARTPPWEEGKTERKKNPWEEEKTERRKKIFLALIYWLGYVELYQWTDDCRRLPSCQRRRGQRKRDGSA
jgi:hypothetical protein